MVYRFDLHIHSSYSHDSRTKINDIIRKAKNQGLDGIAITDHEEFDGALLAEKYSEGLTIIKGEEIKTEYGDIIGLFLNEKICTDKFDDVISEIRRQDGLVILPHPAKYHILTQDVLDNVDAVEVFNSRIGKPENDMGLLLSKKIKKPSVAGSDAHTIYEVGKARTIIRSKDLSLESLKDAIRVGKTDIEGERPSKAIRAYIHLGKLIKGLL